MVSNRKQTKHKFTKESFKKAFVEKVEQISGEKFSEATIQNQFDALSDMVMENIAVTWAENNRKNNMHKNKQIYFFSIEFLIGRLLRSYIYGLGWDEFVPDALKELGLDYDAIQAREHDPALGNGGLGRLMACFLDSTAAMDFPGHGNGIRYKYGLFQQKIVNNEQVEVADNWLRNGYPFEIAKPEKSVIVKYGGQRRGKRKP